ncbi:MAG: tetratricopeptide repeat protein [Nitrospirae bacterium]|jgi:tetratricopeptide (TPR) repeat protein|nr:tetratricopeptide repeat protein [Nitrospirota bacterium]
MSDKSAIIKEAQKYLARGQIDKAISEWEKLVKEFPDGNSFNTLGDLYLKKGSRSTAIESFHKAASYFKQEGFALKALALYKKILNIMPNDTVALFSLGELNEAKGLITDAIKFYLAAADSLSKEGKKEKILEIYGRILSLSPSNIPLRSKVAEIYVRDGLLNEASKQYLQIAALLLDKGEVDKSIIYYQKVLDIEPVNKQAILGLSELYERTGNLNKAVEYIKEAVSLFPDDTDILIRATEICIVNNMYDDAVEYLQKTLEKEPSNIKARRLLGDVYNKRGEKEKAWNEYLPVLDEMILEEKYEDAINLLESFKDIDPLETGKRLVSLYRQIGEQEHVARELISLADVFILRDMKNEAMNCLKEVLNITPEDEIIKLRLIELEKEILKSTLPPEVEKTVDEAILEADIYLKYGLKENARELLESLRDKEPENVLLHQRLKTLYFENNEKEKAVDECLKLYDIYRQNGELDKSNQMLREAFEIDPDNPKLAHISPEEISEKVPETSVPEGPTIDDYSEELSEASFYARQGLFDEARAILERLQSLFPDNEEINQRLASLEQIPITEEPEQIVESTIEPSPVEEVPELLDINEPELDSDVLDILNEFKKGLEKELEPEDYETHYNLGIAYKEMGLIDDAIREFQASKNDPKRFIHSSNMLGVCYLEKGLYSLAIDVLKNAVEKMEDRGESYWAMKYDLAMAYEKNGNLKEALDLYTEVFGWNSKFRAVSSKIDQVRALMTADKTEKKVRDRKDRVSYL